MSYLKDNGLSLFYFYFYFYFIYFLILDFELRYSVILYMTMTRYHTLVIHVIIMLLYQKILFVRIEDSRLYLFFSLCDLEL